MADMALPQDDEQVRARWSGFAWTEENARAAEVVISRYPPGRQHSDSPAAWRLCYDFGWR
jgi:NADH-quinone oxidoreductase subunit E